MPVETVKYRCQFKCGHKSVSSKKAMLLHEITCWSNPANRSCKTCINEIYEKDGCDHPELEGAPSEVWMNRGCKSKRGSEVLELVFQPKDKFHVRPAVNCPWHQQKK